jgi:hypothetical protein
MAELTESVEILTESSADGTKSMFIEGVFMQSERANRNGRFYPKHILARETERYVTEFINRGRSWGELGHPQGPTINLERVSHLIKELRIEGNDFIGKAKITDTPYGNIVKNLINEGGTFGVSTRGMGTLHESKNGYKVVQDDFFLATAADIVADPSAHDAFVRGIMENREWVCVDGVWSDQDIDNTQKIIKKVSSKQLEETKLKIFESFINRL